MDHLAKLVSQIKQRLFVVLLVTNLTLIAGAVVATQMVNTGELSFSLLLWLIIPASLFTVVGISYWIASVMTTTALEPIKYIWQAVLHIAPDHQGTAAPNVENARLGRELLTSLTSQIYQLASTGAKIATMSQDSSQGMAVTVANSLPIPVLVINSQQVIVFANKSVSDYVGTPVNEIVGKNIYSVVDLSFPNEETLDKWLAQCRAQKATASNTWDHIRYNQAEQKTKLLDLVAYYNKDNPSDAETILALFDRTEQYEQDDQALSFVALAVHELRTPLTILRGFIEVLEDEAAEKLDPEMQSFVHKMQASAQQLTSFVNNILSVARVESNQLVLQLKEESWSDTIKAAGEMMELRARVHDKKISYEIAPGLPTVGIDKISITEVINNLLDNAIKYSTKSNQIVVKTYVRQDGMIETIVQDFGIGIPESVVSNLFEKFYRNHRSRTQIGGTGLGLYLSKSIVTAHGGEIWVRSKEGLGTTFGFTVQPYSRVAEQQKNPDNEGITRTAHGWIKNHSFYKR